MCVYNIVVARRRYNVYIPGENASAEPSEKGDGHGPAFRANVAGPQRLTDGVIAFETDGQNGQHRGVRSN